MRAEMDRLRFSFKRCHSLEAQGDIDCDRSLPIRLERICHDKQRHSAEGEEVVIPIYPLSRRLKTFVV